ncbi:PREDICTED: polygalacturonase QRT2-like [Ipomoea nil]|uniref:polygalacturonase QRT2-like n=1 Tax=Ipomoea nil TaxID=35883 RepID=UPI0009010CB0|nr:PREDICTED: polygalacturonase QRT2-like [Ipomoea nil]
MPPTTRNLVLVIFFALSLFSASCDGGSLLHTRTSCHRHHRHRCRYRKHHKGGHTHNKHLKGRKQPHQKVLSVDDFGAKGDGTTDDSEAFKKAWNKFCNSRGSMLVIPNRKTYLLSPTHFSGPCYPNLKLRIHGTIKASGNKNDYKSDRQRWLKFSDLKNFMVDGGGVIDGNGQKWWKDSCKVQKSEICDRGDIPYAVTFQNGTNISVEDLLFKNPQKMHLVFQECHSVRVSNIVIQAPEDSPNTDGIHISHTTDVEITNSVIATGDDCISIVNESNNVRISRIVCGPGHGISIGSLGKMDNLEEHVTNIIVDTVVFKGTTNGVRIKTWQGGRGYARNILFDNIVMKNVTNPIIIDQFYCDNPRDNYGNILPCPEQVGAVGVSNVIYRNIRGTSARELAIRFECSKTVPCKGILLENVNLIGEEDKGVVKAQCYNVKYAIKGHVFPSCG